jgi:TonB family protein
VIHFDFDDRYRDEPVVEGAISRREGLFWSLLAHVGLALLLAVMPSLAMLLPAPDELQPELLVRQETPEDERFVYIEPVNPAQVNQLRERLELSDVDRRAQAPEVAEVPENPLPFSRGDTTERVVASAPEPAAPPPQPPSPPAPLPAEPIFDERDALPDLLPPQPEQQLARNTPPPMTPRVQEDTPRPPVKGVLGDALRNLAQYTQDQTFNNPQGGSNEPGSTIDFDSKGVDFGPWLRRFVNQVRRNWFVPLSAMSFRGRVVLQFNIHRDGRITDVTVVRPSDIESFTKAAYNAIIGSNPTEPLPPEYPDDKVLFTVTFFYNERP